ncbi:MAG: MarR family winged helix-turn-helix transcriptional regulator [Peptostreptococcaceae bacterium]
MTKKMQDIALFSRIMIRRATKEDTMPAQHIELLSQLAISKEKMTPMNLSKIMGVNKTIISRIIENLTQKGYLTKTVDENDKRSYLISITQSGEEELQKIYKHHLEPIYQLRKTIGDNAFFELIKYIEKANIEMLKNGEEIKK